VPLFDCLLDFAGAIFQADDLIDEDDGLGDLGSQIGTDYFFKRYAVCEEVFAGEYERINEILSLPLLDPSIAVIIASFKRAKLVPNFRELIVPFCRVLFASIQSFPIGYKAGTSETLSEEGLKFIRGLDSGGWMMAELHAALAGISIPHFVCECILYRLLMDDLSAFTGLTNDIFRLQKGIKNEWSENFNNSIYRL
jgi:hypothetical protein